MLFTLATAFPNLFIYVNLIYNKYKKGMVVPKSIHIQLRFVGTTYHIHYIPALAFRVLIGNIMHLQMLTPTSTLYLLDNGYTCVQLIKKSSY